MPAELDLTLVPKEGATGPEEATGPGAKDGARASCEAGATMAHATQSLSLRLRAFGDH
jgi:hypothetical protein